MGGGAHGILMLSSNLLKSKIPMSSGGGGEGLVEPIFNFSKFSSKNWNGFVLDFEYQVVPLYEV